MAKTHIIQAVCTVALLAAVPALAQQTSDPAAANPSNMPPQASSTMSPADRMGSDAEHPAAAHRSAMMHSKADTSQDTSVDRLNEQSLQAARSGQAFNAGGSGDSSMQGGSGSMNDMSGGSMTGGGGNARNPVK